MLPLKHVLCPTDFSEDSRAAMRLANEMALYFGAELTLVHVVPTPMPAVWPYEGFGINPVNVDPEPKDTISACRNLMEVDAREHVSPDADLHLEILEGEPAEQILDLADRISADVIVLATHGHTRLRKALFGSTAESIIRESPCPVITMHDGQATRGKEKSFQKQEAEI